MRRFELWSISLVFWLLAACGTDGTTGSESTTCTLDLDCDAGSYCGAGNKCVSDCGPLANGAACPTGETCDSRGRCVAGGDCREDGDCDSPPGASICDGNVVLGYSATGECQVGDDAIAVCAYSQVRTPCDVACRDGECVDDPCDNVFCNKPPLPQCTPDGNSRVVYSSMGQCQTGVCDYQETTESCALGCTNGACNGGTCDNVDCLSPPDGSCDRNLAITYANTGTCDDASGSAVCDYPIAFDNCNYTGATCNNAACENPIVQVGGVVITEYMANPDDVGDRNEWFEIVNTSGAAIDLTNWVIRSGAGANPRTFAIVDNAQTTVPAFADGDILLFAREPDAAGTAVVDYVYDDISLANNGDYLELLNPAAEVVDRVYYESGAVLSGRSRKFNPAIGPDVNANDDFTRWCPSLTDEYTTGPSNFGTPGEANTACTVDPCSVFTCVKPDAFCLSLTEAVQFPNNNVMCESTRFNNPFCDYDATNVDCAATEICALGTCEAIPATLPAAGELVFTEFMGNPSAVSDANGEWFEIYNTTANDLPLFSLNFRDNEMGGPADSWTFLDVNATIAANSYLVVAKNTDTMVNGGVTAGETFSGSHLKNTNIAVDYKLILETQAGDMIDSAYYGGEGGTNVVPTGASLQLKAGTLSAADNDDSTNWCEAVTTYGAGDKGTPGAANDVCN